MTKRYQLIAKYDDHVIFLETSKNTLIFARRIKSKNRKF